MRCDLLGISNYGPTLPLPRYARNFSGISSQGLLKDGIPALSDPNLISADHKNADYLLPTDRVIGIEIDGEYLAFHTTSSGGMRS